MNQVQQAVPTGSVISNRDLAIMSRARAENGKREQATARITAIAERPDRPAGSRPDLNCHSRLASIARRGSAGVCAVVDPDGEERGMAQTDQAWDGASNCVTRALRARSPAWDSCA